MLSRTISGAAFISACVFSTFIISPGLAQSNSRRSNSNTHQQTNISNFGDFSPSFDFDPYGWLNQSTNGRVIPWNFNFTPNPSLKNYPGYSVLPPNVHLNDKYSVYGPLAPNSGRSSGRTPSILGSPNVVNRRGNDLIYGGSINSEPPVVTMPNGDIIYGGNESAQRSRAAINTGKNLPDELFNFRHKTAGISRDENGSIVLRRRRGYNPYIVSPRDRYRRTFVYFGWDSGFFPGDWAYYPLYYPVYEPGLSVYSPYANYDGVAPGWISINGIYIMPPPVVYLPQPIYAPTGEYNGWAADDTDSYYLNQNKDENGNRISSPDPINSELESAMSDIRQAWENKNISLLEKHVKKADKIAVTLRGKYQYSLDSGDYLDMTKDAFRTTKTVNFALENPVRKENGIYVVTGRHVYIDKNGSQRAVFLSYLFEKTDNVYYITQVGTAPDRTGE